LKGRSGRRPDGFVGWTVPSGQFRTERPLRIGNSRNRRAQIAEPAVVLS